MSLSRYRAWDKENNRMVYPSTNDVYFELTDDVINILDMSVEPFDDVFPHLDAVLMQYTGLTDEDGNDVYQGDVIDVFYEDCPMGYYHENHLVGVVDLDKTGTAWVIKNAKYDFDMPVKTPNEIVGFSIYVDLPDEEALEEVFLHNFNLEPEDILILGNIYENPELLEENDGQN